MPRLFAGTREFIDEAVREVFPDAQRQLDLDRDTETGLISFRPPTDLVHRMKALPPDYRREQRLHERLLVTLNRKLADLSLVRARESATSSWPEISLLTDLHPVVEWLTDKVLVSLGRQEAPVITADVAAPTSLVQGIYSNALGRPTVVKWMAVTGDEVTDDMVALLRRAGVGPTMANPLRHHDLDRPSAPASRRPWRPPSASSTGTARTGTERCSSRSSSTSNGSATGNSPAWPASTTRTALARLADSLLTTGRPMLRVLAVLDAASSIPAPASARD